MQRKRDGLRRAGMALAILITLLQIIPLVVVTLNSLRSNDDIARSFIGLPGPVFHFSNYPETWLKGGYLQAYKNTIVIGVLSSFLVVCLSGFAAYGIVKQRVYAPRFFNNYFVASLAIPAFATIVPVYFAFEKLKLTNNPLGMILLYTAMNIPFNYTFIRAFFVGLPRELDEAARIDGATEFQNLLHVVLPLARPIMTSAYLIVFVSVWNEFLFANTFLSKDATRTVALRFYNFVGKYSADYAYVYTAAIITIVPIIALYLIMQKPFVEGMTAGGIKA